ncbi:MAG: hypothetical protein DMG44_05265 [Acidobacteria bacterium]|jgi:hypothetical protein|nr:MAG: hypothetical protein DMG44_05265 [Acidobacteriota bacterium]
MDWRTELALRRKSIHRCCNFVKCLMPDSTQGHSCPFSGIDHSRTLVAYPVALRFHIPGLDEERLNRREACVLSRLHRFFVAFLVLSFFLSAIAEGQEKTVLVATGSSMPEPLYKSWIEAYHQQQPSTDIRYMASGTSESARNTLAGSGDFGGGDAPIPEAQLRAAKKPVLELPAVLIGIVVIFELPCEERAQTHRARSGQYFSRENQSLERSGHRETQSRNETPRTSDSRPPPR